MYDISATNIVITVFGSVTFPNGFAVPELADDADPFDLPSIDIAATAMNLNGDLVSWSTPTPIAPTLAVIPGSESDDNLRVLFEANRAAKGKTVARDIVTIVAVYPDGSSVTVSNGRIVSGMPGKSVASAGRLKSQTYGFAFQDVSYRRAQ